MIILYKYEKATGRYIGSDAGLPEYVIGDMLDDVDFTLTPPPNTYETWYWVDAEWTTEQPS